MNSVRAQPVYDMSGHDPLYMGISGKVGSPNISSLAGWLLRRQSMGAAVDGRSIR